MEIQEIKKIPILEYAAKIGFTPVKAGRYYSLKEHDSVRIDTRKNKFWRNSVGASGSVINFAMHFENLDLAAALKRLTEFASGSCIPTAEIRTVPKETAKTEFYLPKPAADSSAAYHYLTDVRGIDKGVVLEMIKNKYIYQDTRGNAVFVSYNNEKKPDFACIRGTHPEKKFVADVPGSNYKNCFYCRNPGAEMLVVSESVIDAMSYMTRLKRAGRDYGVCDYLALSGVSKYKDALLNHLHEKELSSDGQSFSKIIIALDSDAAGIAASQKIRRLLTETGYKGGIIIDLPKKAKDWNDAISRKKSLDNFINKAVRESAAEDNSPPQKQRGKNTEVIGM